MKLLQYVLVGLALVFLGNALVTEWRVISQLQWQVNYFIFIGALLALIVLFFVDAFGWHLILKSLKIGIHPKTSIKIWVFSSLTRYLPGVVWAYTNRIIWVREYGVSVVQGSTSMLMESILLAVSSLIVGMPAIAAVLGVDGNFLFLGCFSLLMVFSLHPSILSLLRFLPGRLGLSFSEIEYPSFSKIICLLSFYLVFWLFFSVLFVCFGLSLFQLSFDNFLVIASGFSASFAIGFVLIIFPGGIGIREATLYSILTTVLPDSTALVLSIGSRLWLLMGELLTVVVTALFVQWSKKNIQNKEA